MAEQVKTATMDRLQPWQALFGILTYVIGAFDISEWQTLVLCGFLVIGLGFTQRSTYKHKEAIKEVVTPWLVEKLLCILEDYISKPEEPEPPPEEPDPLSELEEIKAKLEEMTDG
jgi:hypothetical protein